jgi:hypothetical protein
MQRVALLQCTLPTARLFFLLPGTVMTSITNREGILLGLTGARYCLVIVTADCFLTRCRPWTFLFRRMDVGDAEKALFT